MVCRHMGKQCVFRTTVTRSLVRYTNTLKLAKRGWVCQDQDGHTNTQKPEQARSDSQILKITAFTPVFHTCVPHNEMGWACGAYG
jgi:hypothetical protein